MDTPLRILLLEDSESDAELAQFELQRAEIACDLLHVATAQEFTSALREFGPDLILADYRVPGYGGMDALADAKARAPGVPFIFVSGTLGEARAVDAVKAGATDYVLKDSLGRLGPAIRRAMAEAAERAARQRAEVALRLQERAVESSFNPILIVDARAHDLPIVYVNPAFERVTGYTRAEAVGRNCRFLQGADRDQPELDRIRAGLREGREVEATLRNFRKDGTRFWIQLFLSPVRDPDGGEITHFVGIQHDVTELRRQQEELRYNADHDMLTGLANRRLLTDRLERAVVWARRYGRRVTVAFMDLDRFKRINDSLGHAAGDDALKAVAARIRTCVREEDTVARMGGDEFVLLLNSQESDGGMRGLQRVVDSVAEPMVLAGSEVSVTCSVGIAQFPGDGADGDTLLRAADAALFRAKDVGRNNIQFYAAGMNAAAMERLRLETQLRTAIERGELALHYQPQVDLATGRIIGAEALLRWTHPVLGMIPPAEFIPLAEESGLIVPVGEWVLNTACEANRRLQAGGFAPVRMAVNISARQFQDSEFPATVARALADSGLAARWLELELTESVVMRGPGDTIPIMDGLHGIGVELSIDDFGTGYSSLSYLKRFPVDRLKIDQSFVRDITTDRDDALITQAVIALGHGLDIKVMAEGVETAAHREFLLARGCDEAQGYYFARPMPLEDYARLLAGGGVIVR